jgi:hypothetical protein
MKLEGVRVLLVCRMWVMITGYVAVQREKPRRMRLI